MGEDTMWVGKVIGTLVATPNSAVDAAIVGIIDTIELDRSLLAGER
jgi:microcompartment protein CcmK/EutM